MSVLCKGCPCFPKAIETSRSLCKVCPSCAKAVHATPKLQRPLRACARCVHPVQRLSMLTKGYKDLWKPVQDVSMLPKATKTSGSHCKVCPCFPNKGWCVTLTNGQYHPLIFVALYTIQINILKKKGGCGWVGLGSFSYGIGIEGHQMFMWTSRSLDQDWSWS